MNRYRLNRNQFTPNDLGSLYVNKDVDEVIKNGFRPAIYIGGQMEHRLHSLENRTGVTFDAGHRIFDGSWFYEYSTKGTKSNINTENFADNFVKCLEAANLDEVDIITESYGGLIAARASKSPRIHKVVAIHPPLLGTPLASNDKLKDALSKLETEQKIVAWLVDKIVNDRYGFQQDNALGINNPRILDSIDFSKLTVVGSNMDRENDESKLARKLYDLIYALEGKKSDGVVLFDEVSYKSLGATCIMENRPTNHFDANSKKNLMRVAAMTLEGFEFEEDEKENDKSRLIGTADNASSKKSYKPVEKVIVSSKKEDMTGIDYFDEDVEEEFEENEDDIEIMSIDEFLTNEDNYAMKLQKIAKEDRQKALKSCCGGSNE